MPLPPTPFELSTWKIATVAPNYHITVDKMNYSVPYEYIKRKVDARMTRSTVEIFFDGNRICSHRRLYGKPNQYSTNEEHMPANHQKYIQWNGERFCIRRPNCPHRTGKLPTLAAHCPRPLTGRPNFCRS